MEKHDYLELIQKYFRDELNQEEQSVFDQLQGNPDFEEQLAQFELLHDLLEIGSILEEAEALDLRSHSEAEVERVKEPLWKQEHTTIALVDDHKLFRKGIVELLHEYKYKVVLEAENGQDFINQLDANSLPDVVLLDINMPVMDGYETAAWLNVNYPQLKVLVLSMYRSEEAVIKMLRAGVKGYITKNADPQSLNAALNDVIEKGFHYSELVTSVPMHENEVYMQREAVNRKTLQVGSLSRRETELLELVCTELPYKEIANVMNLSLRTLETHRELLFKKIGVKSRVGLVKYAIQHGIVPIDQLNSRMGA